MKKILFLSTIAILALSIACNKDKERTEQTFNVEVYRMEDSVEVAPETSAVWLFDGDLEFDWDSSAIRFQNSDYMTLLNGERATFIKELSGYTYKHTFENIKNGKYWLLVNCPINHSTADDGIYPRGYRKITINKETHETTLKFLFTNEDRVHAYYKPFKEK